MNDNQNGFVPFLLDLSDLIQRHYGTGPAVLTGAKKTR